MLLPHYRACALATALVVVGLGCADVAGLADFVPAAGGAGVGAGVPGGAGGVGGGGGAGGDDANVPVVWALPVTGTAEEWVRAIATDPATGNTTLAITYTADAQFLNESFSGVPQQTSSVLAQVSPSGTLVWTRPLNSNGALFLNDIAITSSGEVLAVGWFEGTIDVGDENVVSAGDRDIIVLRYDPATEYLLARAFGTPNRDQALGIAVVDESDSYYVVGHFSGALALSSEDTLVSQGGIDGFVARFQGDSVVSAQLFTGSGANGLNGKQYVARVAASGGGVWVAGGFTEDIAIQGRPHTELGAEDGFIALLSHDSAVLCSHAIGSDEFDSIHALAVNGNGDVFVGGEVGGAVVQGGESIPHFGEADALLASYTSDCSQRFLKGFGDPGVQRIRDMVVGGGLLQVTGDYQGDLGVPNLPLGVRGNQRDGYAYAFDFDGDAVGGWRIGGPNVDIGTAIARGPIGEVYVAGAFRSDLLIGNYALEATDDRDGFLVKFAP